jgi:ABC-type proline/glycine betaine transport system substrate-binding protein
MQKKFVFWMLLLTLGPLHLAQSCEIGRPIMFAELDWDSNRLHTAIARYIIEQGYGCETDAIPGSTIPLITGLTRGDVDVMMEIWSNNIPEVWAKALADNKVVELSINFPDAVQGWYVPRYLLEGDAKRSIEPQAPELKSVFDLPRYKTLFRDPEEPDKGRFYNCILGWQCEVINTKKLQAYGLDEHYTNFRPGTGEALAAAIASAYKRGKPFVAYYWEPTWVTGSYDLVMLDEPPYHEAQWNALNDQENPEVATAYPEVEVIIGVNREFYNAAPKLNKFLDNYETTSSLVSELLAYIEANKASEQEAAMYFLKTKPDIWTTWVPTAVAAQVKASL